MDNSRITICEQLTTFSKLLKEKNKIEKVAGMTKDEYVKKHVKVKKPVKKPIKEVVIPQEPEKPNQNKTLITTVSLVGGIVAGLGVVGLSIVGGLGPIVAMAGMIATEAAFVVPPALKMQKKENQYNQAYEEYQKNLKKVNKTIAANKKNEEYNNTYPELMKQYTDTVKKYELKYDEESTSSKERLDEINDRLKEYEGLISPKYYQNINEIITIIEDGRADSIKEALNIFISDSKQNELIKEQREANRIADKKREDAKRHNLAMENEARRQSDIAARQVDAMKRQEEARRKGAPHCWECKNWPCGGDPAYCGSFVKR